MSSVIDNYLEAIRQATSAPGGIYAYRGQANSEWKLRSSATRRLLEEESDEDAKTKRLKDQDFIKEYLDYHRELIDRARTGGFGIEEGREVTDLQLLAKLQHFRAATGLLDFTRSPLVALWFATEKKDDKNGAIFIVNTNDPVYVKQILDKPDLEDKRDLDLSNIFSSQPGQPNLACLEPMLSGDAKSRILSQRSLFIMGRPSILESSEIIRIIVIHRHVGTSVAAVGRSFEIIKIVIKQEYKKDLREDLERLDVNESSLFRGDIYGFAQVESAESSLPQELDASYYLIQGNKSFQQGEYEDAIANYDQAIQREPKAARAYNNRGVAKHNLGRYADAIADYNKTIELKPGLASPYNNLGTARRGLREYVDAIAAYNKAIELDKDYAEAYYNRGLTKSKLNKLDQYKSAIADYDEAIKLGPDDALAYNNRGIAKYSLGKHDLAIADYDKAIELKPDLAEAYANRGNAKNNLDQYEDAIADFDEAIRLKPDLAGAYVNRGNTKGGLGKYAEAIADYDKAIELKPDLAEAYAGRGNANRALSRMDKVLSRMDEEARKDFEKALFLAISARNKDLAAGIRKELEALDKG